MIPPCLTLRIIRYVLRVKWSHPGKRVAPSTTSRCSTYWKGAFGLPLTTVTNFTFIDNMDLLFLFLFYFSAGNLAILNKSWRQHPTKQQLYGYLLPITKTIKIRQTRHVAYCWIYRDEIISDVLLWTLSHGQTQAGHPATLCQ